MTFAAMESSVFQGRSVGNSQALFSGDGIADGSSEIKRKGLKGDVGHGGSVAEGGSIAQFDSTLPTLRRRKELRMARRSLPGLSLEDRDRCWSPRGGRGEDQGDTGGGREGRGEVPSAVLWTTICTSYVGRTVVLNFRDSGLTDELRSFIHVWNRMCGTVCVEVNISYLSAGPFCSQLLLWCGHTE